MTLVTFIIPTIGRDSLLRALESLYKQTIWDWKAIVIFDGIEPTITVADPRVTLITCEKKGITDVTVTGEQRNNGAGNVRNYGIKKCNTEWVAFLDDDDTLAHTYIETFYNELNVTHNPSVVLFRMRHQEHGIVPNPSTVRIDLYQVGISFIVKRKIFKEGITFIPSHIEDFNLLDRIRNEGYKIVMSPYVKYFVDNYEHTEKDPIKGRRVIINAEDKIAVRC